jgi:hypothetical protein
MLISDSMTTPDLGQEQLFLSAFAKLRKATTSCVMSVRPSVRMEQLGSHWTDFHEMLYLKISRKTAEKIRFIKIGQL